MVKRFKIFTKNLAQAIAEAWTQQHNEWVRKARTHMHQQLCNNVSDIMYNMTIDLFEAIGKRHYPQLEILETIADIRLYDFRYEGNSIIYQFEIDKISDDKLATTILAQLCKNMNRDISQKQHQIVYLYGTKWLASAHPYLYAGIYIIAVKDIGNSVIIDVASHIQP